MEWERDLGKYPAYWRSRLKRGFGLGQGLSYHPWLRVRDVPSIGSSGNPKGITVPRVYHLLSKPERTYFHLVDRERAVVDIREQFPILDLHGTQRICAELSVRHTRSGRYPEPFTLDLFITRWTPEGLVYQARSIKTPEDAADPDVRRRLSVEFRWCADHGIDWKLVDTNGFSDELRATLTFMRRWSQEGYVPDHAVAKRFAAAFYFTYRRNSPLREIVESCAKRLKRGYDECLNDFRYCAWSDLICVDLTALLALHLPVVLRDKPNQ